MPLSTPDDRELIHTRSLHMEAYRRADGNYDIEGQIVDVKPTAHQLLDSHRNAGQPIHDMWLRLTVNLDKEVLSAEARLDTGAHGLCPEVAPNFARLAGLKIGPGWNKRVHERLGHGAGCTHLLEMLSQMATAAIQALWTEGKPSDPRQVKPEDRRLPPGLLNSCYAYRADGPFVREFFPSQYRADD